MGTILAAVALFGLSFVDNAQLNRLSDVSAIDDPAALAAIYDQQATAELKTPDGEDFVLQELLKTYLDK